MVTKKPVKKSKKPTSHTHARSVVKHINKATKTDLPRKYAEKWCKIL